MDVCLFCRWACDSSISPTCVLASAPEDKYTFCERCESLHCRLSSGIKEVLLLMHREVATFSVWGGRREESETHSTGDTRVQPALVLGEDGKTKGNLFLGDLNDVCDGTKLRDRNIKLVVNCCPEQLKDEYVWLVPWLASAGITHVLFPADDNPEFPMVQNLQDEGVLDHISIGLRRGNVLVNCWGGVNRGPCVCLAYLVLVVRQPLLSAFQHCQARRGRILTNYGFRVQLCEAAEAMRGGRLK
jgi:hypothetical protein